MTERAKGGTRKHIHFFEGAHAFINIDKSIVKELELSENDVFVEEVTPEGILLRRVIHAG